MMVLLFWLTVLALFMAATALGRRLGLIPIVSQLLMAGLGLPLLMAYGVEPHWHLHGAALVAPGWVHACYSLAFALLLGQIIGDVIDLNLNRDSLRVALPSFAVPFAAGLACAAWLLPQLSWVSHLALGLVFAITAIPVLYLYLQHIQYPPAATRRLMQAAIFIDLACWSLLGLAQGSLHLATLAWPLLAAFAPWLLHLCRVRQPLAYSLLFFALLVAAEQLKLNALLMGVGYVLNMAWLKLPLVPPLPKRWMAPVQNGIAIPLLLTAGIVQIDLDGALASLSPAQWAAWLFLPIVSKLAGNWLGLAWAGPSPGGTSRWREAVLLNIRGLSEIVFLNLLLKQQLISEAAYLALMLMGLVATLLPALAGLHRIPLNRIDPARRPRA
ncbi:sodium:proton antiporter [Pseudomonas sp. KNUC1026]|uniref:sodium:proton antiporter n=1 Tax=Pseudomonas sp. KNUC1026 TaxID=2893890 RepID=UPI001F2CF642|nr:sodium:proton antiporter [Pseudomonas sp. KNUC1026]UFH49622.1 sodium:proton antiporter [Pseudomonas sp. KNUC1026]